MYKFTTNWVASECLSKKQIKSSLFKLWRAFEGGFNWWGLTEAVKGRKGQWGVRRSERMADKCGEWMNGTSVIDRSKVTGHCSVSSKVYCKQDSSACISVVQQNICRRKATKHPKCFPLVQSKPIAIVDDANKPTLQQHADEIKAQKGVNPSLCLGRQRHRRLAWVLIEWSRIEQTIGDCQVRWNCNNANNHQQ